MLNLTHQTLRSAMLLSSKSLRHIMSIKAIRSGRSRLQSIATMKSRKRFVVALLFGLLAFLDCPQDVSAFSPGVVFRASASPDELPKVLSKQHGKLRKRAVSLHLFFQSPSEVDKTRAVSANNNPRRGVYNPEIYDGLSTGRTTLPYRCITDLPNRLLQAITARTNNSSITAAAARINNSSNLITAATLTLRFMKSRDIPAITQMCVNEYGSFEHGNSDDNHDGFSFLRGLSALSKWFDRQLLQNLVATTMQMKVVASELESVRDHAVIVATITSSDDINQAEHIVGMIEVSQQPVHPDRNPPPYPIPLFWKRTYCRLISKSPLQGWIANLLVVPTARGMGLSKLLVAAAEGIACAEWNCDSIHLHCDADGMRGKIPQQLYLSLGYEPPHEAASVVDPHVDFSWMTVISTTMNGGPADVALSNSIYFIDGVPLLYLKKDLKSSIE